VARRKSGKRTRSKKDKISYALKNEIIGIIIVGFACLGIVILYANNGSRVAVLLADVLRLAAGDGSWGIFVVMAAFGIGFMARSKKNIKLRMIGVLLLWLVMEGLIHLSAAWSFGASELLALGKSGIGGGLVGAGLSILLTFVVGVTGGYIILVVLAAVGSVMLLNRSLIGTVQDIFLLMKKGIGTVIKHIGDFIRVITEGEKQKKHDQPVNIRTVKSKEQLKNIIEYEMETPVTDHKFEFSSEEYDESLIRPKKEEDEQPVYEEIKKQLPGKLTGTPLSRQTEKNVNYKLPPLSLLHRSMKKGQKSNRDMADNVKLLEDTLASFGVKVKVTRVTQGPAITRFEVQPAPGVKVSKITSLADDIALSLAARDIRMEAPIPGKAAVGIEVPNKEISVVHFREVLETEEFQHLQSKLSIALGKDVAGSPVTGDLTRMPHLLIAGATGAGKSVCINTLIASIVFKARPDEVKLLLIDPKMVELTNYNGIPHLISPVVTEPQKAAGALKWIVTEMETRYELFAASGVRDIVRYNYILSEKKDGDQKPLPYVVVIIDELADLMMVAPSEVEESICRLAQMARAAGIHLIVATQRPSVDVITGLIKANIPSRIAFAVSSQIDSRTILDMGGAEKLLGRGDMLYHPIGVNKPIRVQGCFLADKEVKNIVDYLIAQARPEYCEIPEIVLQTSSGAEPEDELFYKAANIFFESNTASVSLLQRRLRIGYTRAARIMDLLEDKGVVGQYEGSKPREILISKGQFEQKYGKIENNQ